MAMNTPHTRHKADLFASAMKLLKVGDPVMVCTIDSPDEWRQATITGQDAAPQLRWLVDGAAFDRFAGVQIVENKSVGKRGLCPLAAWEAGIWRPPMVTCLDCGAHKGDRIHLSRCAACAEKHKAAATSASVERNRDKAAARKAADAAYAARWEAERPQREAAQQAQWAKEAAEREAARAASLLKQRSPEGRAARKAAVDAALTAEDRPIKRGPEGTHSWAIIRIKALEDGDLYPVRWRCRDCGTIKTLEGTLRPEYHFPEGHERHFPQGLPRRNIAGHCPYGPPASKRRSYRDWDPL